MKNREKWLQILCFMQFLKYTQCFMYHLLYWGQWIGVKHWSLVLAAIPVTARKETRNVISVYGHLSVCTFNFFRHSFV